MSHQPPARHRINSTASKGTRSHSEHTLKIVKPGHGAGQSSAPDSIPAAAPLQSDVPAQRLSPVWAIGGGKGGTGKTFFSAAMAQQMSRNGIPVNLVDADFGGPNLHTFLGLQRACLDLSDFFFGNRLSLEDVLSETGQAGIKLAAGSNRRINLANVEYFRKLKLLRHIRSLRGHTIVDTGAGSALNSIEFFNASDVPILVINPNPASMENMFLFLEAVAMRILKLEIRLHGLQEDFKEFRAGSGNPPESVPGFLDFGKRHSKNCERFLRDVLERFQPCLVVNKTRADDDALLGRCVVDVAQRCLSTRIHYVGAVPYDVRVNESLMKFSPFVAAHPASETAVAIMLIMDRLLERSESLGKVR